jgi:hypothetical protein
LRKKPKPEKPTHLHKITKRYNRAIVANQLKCSVYSVDKYLKVGYLKCRKKAELLGCLDPEFTFENFRNDFKRLFDETT